MNNPIERNAIDRVRGDILERIDFSDLKRR
jgi:hypothetical protein